MIKIVPAFDSSTIKKNETTIFRKSIATQGKSTQEEIKMEM